MHGESRAEQMEKQDGVKRKLITEQSRNHGAEQKSRSREEITERSRNHGGKESRVSVQEIDEQSYGSSNQGAEKYSSTTYFGENKSRVPEFVTRTGV